MKITKPTLILNAAVCRANIARMVNKAQSQGLELQPHFKTHQSKQIGQWFQELGVYKITVSSLGMAQYFAASGWNDITVAFPCNILEIDAINELAKDIALTVLVDNSDIAELLNSQVRNSISVYIEIDSGGNRSGIKPHQLEKVRDLANQISASDKLKFKGLYSHAGHTYGAKGESEIQNLANKSIEQLSSLKQLLLSEYPHLIACFGDTPSCSVLDSFANIDRISPGNFVFYDVMQSEIGSCQLQDIAVTVACPVVSIKQEENQLIIYGGAVHFSKDHSGKYGYGQVVEFINNGWEIIEGATLIKVSQEHGIIQLEDGLTSEFKIGDVIGVLPIHSCLTAECLRSYQTLNGELMDHY
ncbi:alanine racemase [Fulvivirga lutea]|uniref:Alanine racemase n=1 Tax=Fulvivirga lutea TaxID=2810512 RepID=A0A974WDI8_9BACT|nr:alanine racemase [Fulvivirga lutea]QSE96089.1 alanine racemase [Fulvivirga lutea]